MSLSKDVWSPRSAVYVGIVVAIAFDLLRIIL